MARQHSLFGFEDLFNAGESFDYIFSDPSIRAIWYDFDKLFSALGTVQSFPPYNIYAIKDGSAKIEVALAGYEQNEIAISVVDGKINISGEKKKKEEEEDGELKYAAYTGIKGSKFKVSIPLETRFDLSKIKAKMKNGILTLYVPLMEERKERSIDISVES